MEPRGGARRYGPRQTFQKRNRGWGWGGPTKQVPSLSGEITEPQARQARPRAAAYAASQGARTRSARRLRDENKKLRSRKMFSTSSLLLWSKCPKPNYRVFRAITWSNALKVLEPFLEIRATLLGDEYGTIALCAGYEGEAWRAKKLAGHILQWLPFAALSQESQNSFATNNWEELVSDAATHVYNTKKTRVRTH